MIIADFERSSTQKVIAFTDDNLYIFLVLNLFGLLFLMATLDNLEQSELTTTRAAI